MHSKKLTKDQDAIIDSVLTKNFQSVILNRVNKPTECRSNAHRHNDLSMLVLYIIVINLL